MPTTPPPLAPIPTLTTIDEVVEAIGLIIDWSVATSSRIGYFAALYKRITIAIDTAVKQGAFEDEVRMQRFDVNFAGHYFAAINGYFHPGQFQQPRRSWQVTFDAARRPELIILQHMLAGVNAHIDLDLGIAAETIAPGKNLAALREDFNKVNAVLASQVNGVLDSIDELSPALADLYGVLMNNEIFLIDEAVKNLRDSAWRFATLLALEPDFMHRLTIWERDRKVANQAELVYDPPGLIGLIDKIVKEIATRESRDVVKNIQVLDQIASTPAPIRTAL